MSVLIKSLLPIAIALTPQVSLSGQKLIDTACMAEIKKADDGTCGAAANAEIKLCMQQNLSKSCSDQYQFVRTKEPDTACKKEIGLVAKSCSKSSSIKGQKCFSSRINPRCQDQLKRAVEQSQKCAKLYQDIIRKCQSTNTQDKQLTCFAEEEVKKVGGSCAEKNNATEAPRSGSL